MEDPNTHLYGTDLFEKWSSRTDLFPAERYLLDRYLSDAKGRVLEAGTGGGRIIFQIEQMGFTELEAFDIVARMVDYCKNMAEQLDSNISFQRADAAGLKKYQSESFDYLIYLQQVLCFVPGDQLQRALKEAHRVAKPGAILLCSFLNWRSRWYNPLISRLVNGVRFLRGEKVERSYLPYLTINGRLNTRLFYRGQARGLWTTAEQIQPQLEAVGFEILEATTQNKILEKQPFGKGILYFAARRI